MKTILIKNVTIFVPTLIGKNFTITRMEGDVLIKDGIFARVGGIIQVKEAHEEIDGTGLWLIPGLIDDQVHFRDLGAWRYKSNFYQETRAAVIGGVTSFMDMHNIQPPTLTYPMLEAKYDYASHVSLANYSFYMGVANDNQAEVENVIRYGQKDVCGLKMFLGSSTGNLLLDDSSVIETTMRNSNGMLIAAHCEDEATIKKNRDYYIERDVTLTAKYHPLIRNTEACYLSSSNAIRLAQATGARLHVFHITTDQEAVELFTNTIPLSEKRITSEVCVHHLYFSSEKDYEKYGNQIVCNPAIKGERHRLELIKAFCDDRIDVIATDHAAHTLWEKILNYWDKENKKQLTPSGVPTIQHSFNIMHELSRKENFPIEKAIQKMTIDVATCYKIANRGAIEMGNRADCFLYNPETTWEVRNAELNDPKGNVATTGGWSPFHGHKFQGKNIMTFVNGHIAYRDGIILEGQMGERLEFNRQY